MSYAIHGEFDVSIDFAFDSEVDIYSGHLYLIGIETEEVFLVHSDYEHEIRSRFPSNSKPIITGWFWEAETYYSFEPTISNNHIVGISGGFHFELESPSSIDGYDVDPGDIFNFVIGSAVDGDSPKILGFSNAEVCGILSNAEEIEDFDFDTL